MGVSKNSGTPKMDGFFILENLMKMDDLKGYPLFLETAIYPPSQVATFQKTTPFFYVENLPGWLQIG